MGLGIGPKLKHICSSLKHCEKLLELRISGVCQNSWHSEGLDAEFDKLLEPFNGFKGIGNVIFTDHETIQTQYQLYEH